MITLWEALRQARMHAPKGTPAEGLSFDEAIELLKQGATDYVLKDRLSRLAPALPRVLAACKHAFDLDCQPEAVSGHLGALAAPRPGLRCSQAGRRSHRSGGL